VYRIIGIEPTLVITGPPVGVSDAIVRGGVVPDTLVVRTQVDGRRRRVD